MPIATHIETPLIKVSFESLKKAAKERKTIVDEATRALSGISSMTANPELTQEEAASQLGSLVEKLTSLKRKLEEVSTNEEIGASRSQARLKYLVDLGEPGEEGSVKWNEGRMDRILADYFLRGGYGQSADAIIESVGLTDLVDSHIFRDAEKVIEGLKGRDCSEALAWCKENRSKLRRIKSKLELMCHLQVFVEMVREDKMMAAIEYSKKHLASWAPQHMSELQRVIATLAFKELFTEDRWDMILNQFLDALYRLNCLTTQSLLNIHLQAGLSALKRPNNYEPGSCQDDPLHLVSFQKLAEGLPFAKYDRSKLICSVTKETMNADNPPRALPNGYVYSAKAIELLKVDGKIKCPITGLVCEESDVRKVFIA